MNTKDSRSSNGKRWGNKFIDKRSWKSYNEELVMRGEFLLPIDMFDNWYEELDETNEGKKGRPYGFPGSSIKIHYGISGLITGLRDGEVAGKMLDALMMITQQYGTEYMTWDRE